MSQYDKLDQLIIERLRTNGFALPFSHIDTRSVHEEAARLEKETGSDSFRIVDRRLQALRKAGKIRHARASEGGPGWVIVKEPSNGS